jgi:hypothetical protein
MRPFIRRVYLASRKLARVDRIAAPWATYVWRQWRRGFTAFDLSSPWDPPQRVCPYCFFSWRGKHHPEEAERQHSQRATAALKGCRCPRLSRRQRAHVLVAAPLKDRRAGLS